jgi:hypothetical protein
MGHERLGFVPKTKHWYNLMDKITNFSIDKDTSFEIASQVLKNVRLQYERLEKDGSIISSFKFLVILSYAAKFKDPHQYLLKEGISLKDDISPLSLSKEINKWVGHNVDSMEYRTFSKSALIETIVEWYQKNESPQIDLFKKSKDPYSVWRKASDGSGFCELSRSYFAKFTGKYLKYFLDRIASSKISNLSQREKLESKINNNINVISEHAFETSKITQSFAAGWYNKYASEELPNENQIKKFIYKAFDKIKSELLIEEKKRDK